MIQEEIEGKVYNFSKNPTFAAVENVTVFDELMTISYIDMSVLKPEDMARDPQDILREQLKGKRLAEYCAKRDMSVQIRTVMLCTGLTEEELQDAPLLPLFKKSCKVLDGTVIDFFLEFKETMFALQTRTLTRFPDFAKSLEPAKTSNLSVNDSPKVKPPKTRASGNSG